VSTKNWKDLYSQIPENRRTRIESYVAGMVARFNKVPLESANLDWRNGWGEVDQMLLGDEILRREQPEPANETVGVMTCVGCGEDTRWVCPFCKIYRREEIPLCASPQCREKHEREYSGCARTAKEK